MSKEGRASYRASKARAAATPRSKGGTGAEPAGGSSGTSKAVYFYNPKTGHYTYRVGGGSPGGGWQRLGTTQPSGYIGGQTRGVATDVDKGKAMQQTEQRELAALKAATTQKEKQVMELQYAMQTFKYSPGALKKTQEAQQEIMEGMPETKEKKVAFDISGRTFTGTYGLSRTAPKTDEVMLPLAQFSTKTNESIYPFAPPRQKEAQETIDVMALPLSIPVPFAEKGLLTEVKAPEGKWAGSLYEIRKGLETKEIELLRKGDKGLADIYGSGSAVLYPVRTPESTLKLGKTFGKGVAVGVGITVLSLTTGPIIPATLLYGGSIYGATQVPKLQEQIAESKYLGPVAYRETLAKTGEHAAAAIGGAYVSSLLVPATITSYKKWHHGRLVGDTTAKGDYIWKKGYYSKDTLKQWEETLVKSKFISEIQKQAVLKGKGDYTWKKGFLEKGHGKVLSYKKQDFFNIKQEQLGLPSQARQAQLGFERFRIIPTTKAELQLSEVARIQAAMKTNQYLGKWIIRPSLKPKADYGISYPKFSHPEQYQLYDITGKSFFESSYFTGYKPGPVSLLEYKPVGKVESLMQRITNVEYSIPKVFIGKKGSLALEQAYPSGTYKFSDSGSIFDKGRFSNMFGKGKESLLSKNQFKKIGEVTTGQKDYSVYEWAFFPASREGLPTGKIKDKSIVELQPLQLQKQRLSQEQLLAQEQKLELKSITKLDVSQIQVQKQLQKQETLQKQKQILDTTQIQGTAQVLDIKQITKGKQVLDTIQITKPEFPIVPIEAPKPTEPIIEPPPRIIVPGLPSLSLSKKKAMPDIDLGSPILVPRKRGVDIAPLSDLLSINITEMFTGRRATHPKITEEEKLLFDIGIKRGRQYFPTMEMRAGKVKLPRSYSIFGTTKRKHKKSRKRGDWVFDLL